MSTSLLEPRGPAAAGAAVVAVGVPGVTTRRTRRRRRRADQPATLRRTGLQGWDAKRIGPWNKCHHSIHSNHSNHHDRTLSMTIHSVIIQSIHRNHDHVPETTTAAGSGSGLADIGPS